MGVRHIRTHSRHRIDCRITVESRSRETIVVGRLVDVSEGGAACQLEAPLRMGEQVTLRIQGSTPVVLAAEVAWVAWGESTHVRLGLRFLPGQDGFVSDLFASVAVPGDVGT